MYSSGKHSDRTIKRIGIVAALLGGVIAASAPANSAPLKVGVLLPGGVSDHGYNADGARAAETLKSQLHADTKVTENVSIANQADVYRQFAAAGYDLIIGWGGQFTDGAVQVSEEFPKVKFLLVNGEAQNGKNLASLDTNVEDWEFLGGFVTAKLAKGKAIGWIGGQCFPATAANLHGVEQGAKYADPKVHIVSTFTGDFEDPIKAQQTAAAMIENSGAAALTGNLNNGWFGVFKEAQSHGKVPLVTEWTDNHQLAQDVIASSIQKSQARFVLQIAKLVADGHFEAKHYQFGLPADWGPVMAKTALLPQEIYDEALRVQKDITSGKVHPVHDVSCPK